MKLIKWFIVLLHLIFVISCSDNKDEVSPDLTDNNFIKGADVSWITEMEASGTKFYNEAGVSVDGISLLKSYGVNAVRLRVWVDPVNGWNSKNDVLVKALRAKNLGMKILIDFHYSDTWADPGQQTKPAQWTTLNFQQLKGVLATHTKDVLSLLKTNSISVDWVQVGNETGNGILWEDGKASVNMKNYAELNTAGYDAVKEVFPDAKVIVHVQNGADNGLFRWIFDGLKNNGSKWDIIGMSLYPTKDNWSQLTASCLSNIEDMISRYNSEVMICEVGMSWDEEDAAYNWLTELIAKSKDIHNSKVLGVFYWEPLAYGNWKGYTLGAFNDQGRPTKVLNAFK